MRKPLIPPRPGWNEVTLSDFVEHVASTHWNGISPGAVQGADDISRQAVHKAISSGRIAAWRIVDDRTRKLRAIVVPMPEVTRYREMRRARTG